MLICFTFSTKQAVTTNNVYDTQLVPQRVLFSIVHDK